MTPSTTGPAGAARKLRTREQARVRTLLLLLVSFLLGLAGGAFWFYRTTGRNASGLERVVGVVRPLSEGTQAVLQRLDSPVEIRFYSLLDPASVSQALQAFAGRVDQLLAEYESEAQGKIKVVRFNAQSDAASAAAAATADGLRPFNLDKGEACFLGIAVAKDARKESLPRLYPEWEEALEADLSRAIERVYQSRPPAQPFAALPPPDTAAIEAVRRSIPDLASVSVDEGTRILREAALKEFTAAAKDMESQVQEAQQRLNQARQSHSEAEQQAAVQHLRQVQAQQTEKLQQIAARSQAQIAALKQLKETAR